MKIVLLSHNAQSLDTLQALLQRSDTPVEVAPHTGGVEALRKFADEDRAPVLILDTPGLSAAEFALVEEVATQHPHSFIILVCPEQSPEFLLSAMRVGVREVLPAPLNQAALDAALARVAAKISVRGAPSSAQVFAFISSKGGSGATFLAANIGDQLAEDRKKVLLIDLNLQFGEAALTLSDRKPESDIVQVAHNLARLDAHFLEASLIHINSNYAVLAAPDDPAKAMDVRPEHLEAILKLAASRYDYILLDVNRQLDDLTVKALDRANLIFVVLQATMPYIRNANRLMSVFRSLGYSPDKVAVLVNRYWKNDEIGLNQVRASLGLSKMHTIPNGYKDVAKAINLGVPLAQVSRSGPVFRAIRELVDSLTHKREDAPAGLFSRFLRT